MPSKKTRPTMRDIADRIGVFKALVSLVFRNGAGPAPTPARECSPPTTNSAIEWIARRRCCLPADRTWSVSRPAVRNGFHAEMVENLVEVADRTGYECARRGDAETP